MKITNMNVDFFDEIGASLSKNTVFSVQTEERKVDSVVLAPLESKQLISGSFGLLHNNTTNYSTSFTSGNTYRVNYISGTDPLFRTKRVHLGDSTSVFSISKVGNAMAISLTAGTSPAFDTNIIPGDKLQIRNLNISNLNLGIFTVLVVSPDSITLDNPNIVNENFTLSANSDLNAFSTSGVQSGDSLSLGAPFFTKGQFNITEATNEYLEFTSTKALPNEGPYSYVVGALSVFSSFYSLVSIASSEDLEITIDGKVLNISKINQSSGATNDALFITTQKTSDVSIKNLSSSNSSQVKIFAIG